MMLQDSSSSPITGGEPPMDSTSAFQGQQYQSTPHLNNEDNQSFKTDVDVVTPDTVVDIHDQCLDQDDATDYNDYTDLSNDHYSDVEKQKLNMQQLLQNFEDNEPIFDNELLYPTPKESEIVHFKSENVLAQGTVEALITYLTSPEVLNYQFLVDFFLTFRTYIDALPLLELLLCRLSWCMKKSLSEDNEQSHIGRLVLVRTFVTIRHWLLNHFQDDFVDNLILRTLLTDTVNELAIHEKYVGTDPFNLQSKIIKDLKRNYLTLTALYWNTQERVDVDELLNYRISSYDDLNRSRLSTLGMNQMYDPTVRRSTLLYMVDNQSSSNVLLDSLKNGSTVNSSPEQNLNPLEHYLEKQFGKSKAKNIKDNFVLFPKDSLKALDLSKLNNRSTANFDGSSIDQLCNSIMKNELIPGFVPLGKSVSEKSVLNDGFTIRGNINVFQDSTVNHIESLVKELPKPQPKTPKVTHKPNSTEEEKVSSKVQINVPLQNVSNIKGKPKKKRGFFKSLFNHNQEKETKHAVTTNVKSATQTTLKTATNNENESKPAPTSSKFQNGRTVYDMIQSLEDGLIVNDGNMDYLEEIVIRDYQNLIQHKTFKNRYSKQLKNSSRKSVLSMGFDLKDRDSKFDPSDSPTKFNKAWLNESQLERSINELGKGNSPDPEQKSFQTPPQTIDWSKSVGDEEAGNGEGNDTFEGGDFVDMDVLNSDQDDILEQSSEIKLNKLDITQNSFTRKRNTTEIASYKNSRKTFHCLNNSSGTTLNKIVKGKHNSDSNVISKTITHKREISQKENAFINIFQGDNCSTNFDSDRYNDTFSTNQGVNRFSVNFVGRSSVLSSRSYVTYDSEYSMSSKDRNPGMDHTEENLLRKKHAFSNLRINKLSIAGESQRDGGKEKEEEENEATPESEAEEGKEDDDDDRYDDFTQDMSQLDMSFNLNAHEIVENAFQDTVDLEHLEDQSVLAELKELPFFKSNLLDNDRNNFFVNNRESSISILPSPSPSQAGYNGLSQTDINELAAIPDEKLEDDPLNYTLSKLRGERKQPKVILGLNDTKLNNEEIHRKHAVAVVCQSPTKNQSETLNMNETLGDAFNKLNDSNDGQNEFMLEQQVRDLYIVNNPNDSSGSRNLTKSRSLGSTNKLEMNLVAQLQQNKETGKDSGSIMTGVSSGMLLRDDGERSCFDMQSLFATPKGLQSRLPIITIHEILNNQQHIPFIFKYDSETLASQMTLIERDIILEVDWRELINLKWDQPLSPYNSWLKLMVDLSHKTGLELITLRFNLMNNWIISEILLCKDITLRVLTITRFIQLAQRCRQLQNYGTLFQIMLALNSEVMKQLSSTWIRVDPGTILKFKELKDLTSPNNNFKNYRDETDNIVPSKGFIPFLPLALSDLTMCSEMPTIMSGSNDVKSEMDSILEFESESVINYDLVNFEKFTITGETVKRTLRHIEWSRFYKFETNEEVISKCLYISSLSEEDMEICLGEIENSVPSNA